MISEISYNREPQSPSQAT